MNFENLKNVKVDRETWVLLSRVKLDKEMRSISEVIKLLVDNYNKEDENGEGRIGKY